MSCRVARSGEEIGQGPFSTGSSYEPVLKVQRWPTSTSKLDGNPFVPVRNTKGPQRTGIDVSRRPGQCRFVREPILKAWTEAHFSTSVNTRIIGPS
jgi:hypothetical protein